MLKAFLFLFIGLCLPLISIADVVKPALIEVSVNADSQITVEIRTSLEALLSSIDGRYQNTQDAPTAEQYDLFRQQSSSQLAQSFLSFHGNLIEGIKLTVDENPVTLEIASISIPEPGYTRVPRTSVIVLNGSTHGNPQSLQWYYPLSFGDQAVRVKLIDADRDYWYWSDYQWIREDRYSEPFEIGGLVVKSSWLDVLYTYLEAGFLHIIPGGLDHILFILGLFLLSQNFRVLAWQVTMFTLAHSVTLSLSVLELVSVPSSLVEPLIALSITYVAVENLLRRQLNKSRLWVVFAFGLLHGLGFAAMLTEFGLPADGFALALVGFNLGVEAGQLGLLLLAWSTIGLCLRHWPQYRQYLVVPASLSIAAIGLIWFWQRLPFS